MQSKASMDFKFCLSEEHFSLDILVMRLLKGKGTDCSCGGNHWRLNGDFNRRIRTRLGAVELPFRRVSCRVCGRTHSPLQRLLKQGRYQTKTNELKKLVVKTARCRPAVEGLRRLPAQPYCARMGSSHGVRRDCASP